jgi:Ca-activated chloride channel homolog
MKMMKFLLLVLSLLLPLALGSTIVSSQDKSDKPPLTIAAQEPKPPTKSSDDPNLEDDSFPAIKIGGEVVLVNVLVTDSKNNYVQSLVKEEFEVFEDGKKQEISFFTKQDEPISIGILVDTSLSMLENGKILEAQAAVRALLGSSNPRDEFFLMKFDDRAVILQEFTNDRDLLGKQVERLKPFGGTALYDGVIRAMKEINQNAKRLRQALVVISDGIDQHSKNTLQNVTLAAQLTGIPCYIIGAYSPEELRLFAQAQAQKIPLKFENGQLFDNPLSALRNLAEETAGRAFFPNNEKELVPIALQIVNELRAGYALGYYPPNNSLDGRYHSISVVSKSKKYVVRARRGYISRIERP